MPHDISADLPLLANMQNPPKIASSTGKNMCKNYLPETKGPAESPVVITVQRAVFQSEEEDSAYQIQDAKHRLLATFRDSARCCAF